MGRWAGCGSAPVWASWRRDPERKQNRQATSRISDSVAQLRSHRWGDPRWGSRCTSWRRPLFRGPPPADGSRSRRLWWPPRPLNASFLPPRRHSPVKKNKTIFKLDWKSSKTLCCSCFVSHTELRIYFTILSLCLRPQAAGQEILWIQDTHTQTHAHSPASNIPTNLLTLNLNQNPVLTLT